MRLFCPDRASDMEYTESTGDEDSTGEENNFSEDYDGEGMSDKDAVNAE